MSLFNATVKAGNQRDFGGIRLVLVLLMSEHNVRSFPSDSALLLLF